ncbi:MAG: bifunctional nuclease family protein [Flammeovirgaceae bacterium]|nr:bifunctional nuclease family protein [Flammeovirgaceae bacterium]MDW8288896.1 bifunctional nuclease family protein [Flammeovirgaceae bacterium]
MEKVKLEILGLQATHAQSGSFALVLGEETGKKRRLPIIIGMFEAQSIAIEIEKIPSIRPMTHDLFKSFALSFDIKIHEIIINDLKEGIFYSRIICSFSNGTNQVEIDARPSDAVAIGIRFNAPIYALEKVMQEAAIDISEVAQQEENMEEDFKSPKPRQNVKHYADDEPLAKMTTRHLKEMLNTAIAQEDYEKAARIRDELKKRNEHKSD